MKRGGNETWKVEVVVQERRGDGEVVESNHVKNRFRNESDDRRKRG